MLVAESKEDLVREKGEEWAAGAIPFFGGELINVMKAGELGKAVDKAAIELAMAVWLFDSIYCGLSPEVFVKCDLDLTMWHDGTVVCTRVLG
ncbi:hypothetical protein SAMN06265784_1232 [Paraburkholderia susongensis]|uniref:Uncharacterized protein n=2 Tax=Paraburkholderia susongensis TaxID=1515439 RepID=A0A1X7M5Q2_9BURK|nr:hypothetical protein SAMN06265784_1232 [Paraburkholderia susongensis]